MNRVSLFYMVGVFDLWGGLRTLSVSAGGAYAIAKFVQGPYMPWIAFVYLMGHMLISHIGRELHGIPGVVDVTGAQMVMVMKVGRLRFEEFWRRAETHGFGVPVDGILLVST